MQSYWKHFFIDNGDISLIESGVQKYLPDQINDYTVKHDYVFHLVLSGKGLYRVNGQTHQLSANDGFVLKKNHEVYYEPDPIDPWTICWIGIGGKNIDYYIKNTLLYSTDCFSFPKNSHVYQETIDIVKALETINVITPQHKAHVFSFMYQFLDKINEELLSKEELPDTYKLAERSFAEQIYSYILDHFQSDLTVEDIAKHFEISRNYLFKICKKFYEQSPKQIVQELRMNRAAQLLRGSQMKVNEIADLIGYKDPFQFSKIFKNYYGHNPSQFRFLSDEEIDEALFIRDKFLN